MLVASLVAPATQHIGLVPTATTTYTEPFHLASAISTLDYVSKGRGGWRPGCRAGRATPTLVGVRAGAGPARPALRDLFDEAADAVEVVRRLWDSWEDDAIIKDVATGRFVDRDKLHYVDFEGRFFSVKGPSIVPRPPQGQPIVAALAHQPIPFEFAARSGDVVFVTPADTDDVARWIADVRGAEAAVGRERRAAAAVRRPRRVPRRQPRRRRPPARPTLDELRRVRAPLRRRARSSARPTSWPTCRWPGTTSASRGSACARP